MLNEKIDKLPNKDEKKGMYAKDVWQKDFARTKFLQQNGFKVLCFWQSEIKKDISSVVKEILEEIK